jgi:hypothetical protein
MMDNLNSAAYNTGSIAARAAYKAGAGIHRALSFVLLNSLS